MIGASDLLKLLGMLLAYMTRGKSVAAANKGVELHFGKKADPWLRVLTSKVGMQYKMLINEVNGAATRP